MFNNTGIDAINYKLLNELFTTLQQLLRKNCRNMSCDEVKQFVQKHRDVPGFKQMAIALIIDEEERAAKANVAPERAAARANPVVARAR